MVTATEKMISFLETHIISLIYSAQGLKYLSLRGTKNTRCQNCRQINLREFDSKKKPDAVERLVIKETIKFLETGKHDMPLDLSALTDFQQSVFQVVSKIEPGKIITYQGIAQLLGKPGGAQAVGNAVTKNPVSYFLPVHRVLPKRGLGICRSGAGHLREKLLAHEGHDISKLRGNYVCTRKKCCME